MYARIVYVKILTMFMYALVVCLKNNFLFIYYIDMSNEKKDEINNKDFLKKHNKKFRYLACFSSFSTLGLAIASAFGLVSAPVVAVPAGLAMISTFLIKNGITSLKDLKQFFTDELQNDPEKLTEVMDTLSEIQSKAPSTSRTTEPISIQNTPVNDEFRKNVRVWYNTKSKKIEYVYDD